MKRTTKKLGGEGQFAIVRSEDHSVLLAQFAQCPELFAPMLELIASGQQTIPSVRDRFFEM
jgi:hypothetical protein